MNPFGEGRSRPFVWAHRGASALAPENTMRAFALAVELGTDGIELDLHLTADGVAVVVHDRFLWAEGDQLVLRPAPGDNAALRRLPIASLTWSDIETAPVRHPDGSHELVPRFEQVLEAVPESVWLDVELKAGWTFDEHLAEVFCKTVRARPEHVLASSFDHVILKAVAEREQSIPLLAILHARPVDLAGLLSSIPTRMASIDRAFLTAADVERWHGEGLEMSIGGRELLLDLPEVLAWPVSAVFLDDPRLGLPV